MESKKSIKQLLFIVFIISGFTGLVYESIWTHYLKLVLGHAAYSQTLVLAIFMGGMAVGAWLISRVTQKISNPVLIYAAIELVIGCFALFFHDIFIYLQELLYVVIREDIHSANTASVIRWVWASLLILPQSILLGATFPLLSAGIVRLSPNRTGSILSMLYFTNSIGAAFGVLVSGFFLIDTVGLPGTILTAGILNILLAIFVWGIAKSTPVADQKSAGSAGNASSESFPFTRRFLIASFLTGLASFCYEIGWIRMLNQVLGSSIQSFELMLSAFITGIAFGGLWIRNRIDKIKNVLRFSGYVQIIMGLLAVLTLSLYNSTFDFMHYIMNTVQRDESGYLLFNSSSHLIAFAIMVPAAFMAGMTLPLFTFTYMKSGYGERGVGRIYAANTLGSITGIILAVHIIMPVFGLKNLISLGAIIDILLGLTLIYLGGNKHFTVKHKIIAVSSLSLFLLVNIFAEFDKGKMASGIYRNGLYSVRNDQIIFQKDGKTSTVVVQEIKGSDNVTELTIRTNGKPDASVSFDKYRPTIDEPTMLLSAAFPLAAHPEAETAAVIGIGSGISTNALLKTDRLLTVDTIEIESAMVEGARYFKQYSELVFSDPRSRIHIDDAKSFFAVNNKRYDIILSEPSNVWVSGVAGLFTEEFYRQIKPHLNDGGVFAQWLQIYEIDMGLVSSVLKALRNEFKYYVVYQTVFSDVIILASDDNKILAFDPWIFEQKPLADSLSRVFIKNINDLYARRVATNSSIDFLVDSYQNKPNSDYFPTLTRQAPKSRFLRHNAINFGQLPYLDFPVIDFIDPLPEGASRLNLTRSAFLEASINEYKAKLIFNCLVKNIDYCKPGNNKLDSAINSSISDIRTYLDECQVMDSLNRSFVNAAHLINMYLPELKTEKIWSRLLNNPCNNKLSRQSKYVLEMLKATGQRDVHEIQKAATHLWDNGIYDLGFSRKHLSYLYGATQSSFVASNKFNDAKNFFSHATNIYDQTYPVPLNIRLLHEMIFSDSTSHLKATVNN